jgi:arylsulfatase A-like enzyme
MRLIYFDIDTLRPDHLSCYGYRRGTSPNIDAIATEGIRFDNVYASDTPCLPSRTALITGRFGIRTGVIGHGGTSADLFVEGPGRGFRSEVASNSWVDAMGRAGVRSASISTFARRHSAYHFHAGFNETYDLGTMGMETADQVASMACDWLKRNGSADDWFLHIHMWDPHTPYRTPESFGDPFGDDQVSGWLTEAVRAAHWTLPGPHSAQEMAGFGPRAEWRNWRRQPQVASDMNEIGRMFDGYDTAIRYVDHHVGQIVNQLADLGVLDDTALMVSSDHGENLGELGIYCDHQTADFQTARLPMVLRWPGLGTTRVDPDLHYQIDVAATVLELLGATVPEGWDGIPFSTGSTPTSPVSSRDYLVVSQAAWTAQRSVRFGNWICIRTYHDAFHGFPDVMLFDVVADPHEERDVADDHPLVVEHASSLLEQWQTDAMRRSTSDVDPLWTVLREGGPWHSRGCSPHYLRRLRATGRGEWADRLTVSHPFGSFAGAGRASDAPTPS